MLNQSNALKLVLADTSVIVRSGIQRLLANVPEIQIVKSCNNAQSLIAAIAETQPDIVMLDFDLGDGTAVEVMQRCRRMRPRPICVVNTFDTDAATRAISYGAGADVFFDKRQNAAPLIEMLRKVSATLLESDILAAA